MKYTLIALLFTLVGCKSLTHPFNYSMLYNNTPTPVQVMVLYSYEFSHWDDRQNNMHNFYRLDDDHDIVLNSAKQYAKNSDGERVAVLENGEMLAFRWRDDIMPNAEVLIIANGDTLVSDYEQLVRSAVPYNEYFHTGKKKRVFVIPLEP